MMFRSLRVMLTISAILAGSGWSATHNTPLIARADAPIGVRANMPDNDQVHAELSNQGLTMICTPPQLMSIAWTTALEENVAGYRVHRHSLDGRQAHAWVNSVPIAARGPSDYRILDADAFPNRRYLYRLYAFDATYQLSHAEQIILANPAQPTCLHLPITRHER